MILPDLFAERLPAMNRYSEAFTRVICEYCPSGFPSDGGIQDLDLGGHGASFFSCWEMPRKRSIPNAMTERRLRADVYSSRSLAQVS